MQTNPIETPEKLGLAGRIVGVFLRNQELSVLTIIVLAAWGVLSFILMPKQYNPEIVAPAFVVTTSFPGASAEEVYELITRPMEDKLSELPDVDEISSQSIPGGQSQVTVKFYVGSDREAAKITLNQKLRDNISEKPSAAAEPIVQSIDPDDVPILDIGLSSPSLSESSLRKLAFDAADELKLAEGISKVEIKGGRTNHLQAALDGSLMAARNVSTDEVVAALSSSNGVYTFDRLHTDDRDQTVNIIGSLADTDALGALIIREERGSVVRLRDIAEVSYGPGEITDYVRRTEKDAEGSPVVHIALSKLKGSNSTDVSQRALDLLESLKGRLIPSDTVVTVLNDEGKTASDEIGKLTFDLAKSIAIVGVLLFIFLGTKNSLIASISIPLVLLAVFGTGLLFGQTINRITLFALILSLGLLVDDAIVVVENIARYFRLYPEEKRLTLIIRAVDEVGGALALSTFTMALAFVPMAFVTGMMGPYMGPIPFFVPVALFASLIFSVTLNPFLAYVFAKKGAGKPEDHSYESGFFYRLVKRIEARYAIFLSSLIAKKGKRRRFLTGTFAILIISLILPMTSLVPFRMLPKADKDQFYAYLDLPDGTSIDQTDAVTRALEQTMLAEDGIESAESFVGQSQVIDFNGLFKGSSSRILGNQATIKAHLAHHTDRDITSEEIAVSLRQQLDAFLREYPDATIRLVEDPPGPPVLSTFLLKVKGDDMAMRERITRDLEQKIHSIRGIVDIDTSLPERGLDLSYHVDTEKAGLLGVSPREISSTLHTALSGASVGLYHGSVREGLRKPEQEHIIVRFSPETRDEERDLSLITLAGKGGVRVPLTEVLVETNDTIDTAIASDERRQTGYLSGEMEGRSVIYAVLDLFPELLDYRLPDGSGTLVSWSLLGATYEDAATHARYVIEIGGEWKLTLEVFRDLGIAMGLAIFLIYFVLSAKTESLFIPLLIMVSIPLSLIGVLPGFAILQAVKGTYFNATSMIGVIALAGLAVKNAVIYLEYLEPLKKAGRPIEEALVEAGRIRLLPIALTSLAAILGSFTIVSDPVWEGLAWAIIFGLTASTVLTLVVFPLVYYVSERKSWYHTEKEHH
jgi:multidrug efflux pump subunit AcrB